MASLIDLATRLEKYATSVETQVSDLTVKVAITIITDLVYRTPVDTSRALSNWIASIGTNAGGVIPPHFPGKGGSSQRASAQETIDTARTILKDRRTGQPIHISNNLPYIQRLNEGYSGQAPAGFVEASVLVGNNALRNFKFKAF